MQKFLMCLLLTLSTFSTPVFSNSIKEFTLENGLTLIVKSDHRSPVAVSEIWYKVGSSYESGGMTGISHVLEHMMFRGTKSYPAGQFSKLIAQRGGSHNAATSYDFTFYFQELAAKDIELSFKLEADRMQNLVFTEEDFAKELNIVKEERRLRTDDVPEMLTYERFMAAAHIAAPYHHPIIGWMSDLNHLTVKNVSDWYHTWYAPNNATLVVVGDVDLEKIHQLVIKHFGKIPKNEVPQLKPRIEPPSTGPRKVVVSAATKLPMLYVGYNTPSLNTAKEKWHAYALTVMAGILDAGPSSRLAKELVRKQNIATDAGANYDLYSLHSGLFALTVIPSQGHTVKEVRQALLDQIKKLQDTPVNEKELERVKNQVVATKVYRKDSMILQANEIGSLESLGLSWKTADEYINAIQAITPSQVQSVAKMYLVHDKITVAVLEPQTMQVVKTTEDEKDAEK